MDKPFRLPNLTVGVQLGGSIWWLPRGDFKPIEYPERRGHMLTFGWLYVGVFISLTRWADTPEILPNA